MADLKEKVVLVTGASSGIGRGCALDFASKGSYLAITGRKLDALNEVKKNCVAAGVPDEKVLVIQAELDKEEETEKVLSSTIAHFGRLDVLVNSAGILIPGSTEATTMSDYDQVMNVNLRAPFYMTKLAIPHLLKTKGNIVNISSVTGLRAFPNVISYAISKAGMDQLTRSLALEVAGRGVRVNAVNPGVIVTECHKRGGMSDEAYEKFLEHSKTTHAMGRAGEVDEVATAVSFLASSAASFITGATLPIDGGRSVMCPR